jgi:O-antigen ligase
MIGVAVWRRLPLIGRPETRNLPLVRDATLAGFFVALAFSISLSQILLAALAGLALAREGRTARPGLSRIARALWEDSASLRRHPLTPPFLCFVGLTLLSALFSGDVGWSLWISRDTLRIATFYVVLACTRDSAHALRLWQGFLVVLTLMACYGLAQAYLCGARPPVIPEAWLAEICTHAQRVRGPFSIYMTFGGVLLLSALFFLAYLANVSWRAAGWMVPAALVTVGALALTYSRNAWLGLAAGVLGLVVTARQAGRLIVALLAVVLVVGALAPGAVVERARSMVDPQDPTVRDRLAMWQSGLAMVADRPFLGVGPGEVRTWYGQYRQPWAVRSSTGHLHNSPIQIAAERGLPALGIWVWIWIVFLTRGGRVLRRLGRGAAPRQRALVCASLAGVVGFLVAGLFEHNFGDGEVVMVVYALMALPFVVERELAEAGPRGPRGLRSAGSDSRSAGASPARTPAG